MTALPSGVQPCTPLPASMRRLLIFAPEQVGQDASMMVEMDAPCVSKPSTN